MLLVLSTPHYTEKFVIIWIGEVPPQQASKQDPNIGGHLSTMEISGAQYQIRSQG